MIRANENEDQEYVVKAVSSLNLFPQPNGECSRVPEIANDF